MRLLALLLALFSMPVLAADHSSAGIELLAQAAPQGQSQGGQQQSGPQRYPGDYCTRHCRHNETPCGNECLAPKDGVAAKCMKKVTTTCGGKP
jgi:hypothetical protein